MDDRDRRGRVSDGKSGGRCDNNDRVNLQPNHLRGEILKSLGVTLCIPALDNEVLPLCVPKFTETLEQGIVKLLIPVRDKPDPPDFARLLRTRNKRQSCYPSEYGKEYAPLHVPSPRDKLLLSTN
jgi:hypothetical protein